MLHSGCLLLRVKEKAAGKKGGGRADLPAALLSGFYSLSLPISDQSTLLLIRLTIGLLVQLAFLFASPSVSSFARLT